MSLPLYNSVKSPSAVVLLKWTRKGKTSIQSEDTLTTDFAPYAISVLGSNIKCGQ